MESPNHSPDPIALYQYALSLHNSGRLAEAEALYQQLLKQFPDNPLLLTGLGIIALQRGNLHEGVGLLERSVQIEPNQPMAHSNLGLALRNLKRLGEALRNFNRAIALDPDFEDAYNYRGIVLQDLKRLDEALKSFDRAIALKPDYDSAYNNRGVVLQDLNRWDEALESFGRAISLRPGSADAYCNHGNVLRLLGRLDEALESCDRAVALKPDYALAYNNRGNVLQDLSRLDDAIESYDRAISLNPDYAEAYCNRGSTLRKLNRLDEALVSHNRAIALKPGYAEAYYNRGIVLHDLNRLNEALESYDRAISLNPNYVAVYNNRGITLQNLKRLDEARTSFDRAIALERDNALAYWNRSLVSLLAGDFEEGWKLYEWRWKEAQKDSVRNFTQPLWLGCQSVSGKTLLIHAEQGLGDVIQFCRYAAMAKSLGAKIILEVPAALISLISTLKVDLVVVEKGGPLPPFDLHCPIMSLPLAFKTTMASIPASVPYLYVDDDKWRQWHQRLGNKSKPRIGLVWSGSVTHKNDRNRSISLHLLKPLIQVPVEFHALQKEIRPDDAAVLSEFGQVHSHQKELHDFSDTAALIQEMDLVISVDTSVAHLAGALDKPVWILLPYAPDYRWMLDRTDSPWYPTATLFRQPAMGDWPSVIADVGMRLRSDTALNKSRQLPHYYKEFP
jgi:tetratricopeptide (TPR) repeat protein